MPEFCELEFYLCSNLILHQRIVQFGRLSKRSQKEYREQGASKTLEASENPKNLRT